MERKCRLPRAREKTAYTGVYTGVILLIAHKALKGYRYDKHSWNQKYTANYKVLKKL